METDSKVRGMELCSREEASLSDWGSVDEDYARRPCYSGSDVKHGSRPGGSTLVVTRHCPVEMRRSNWSIDQFVVAKKLGGGYASTVHLAICKATGTQVAIKVYHRCKLSQLNNYQVHREIRIHSCLDHKNVLQLYAAFEDEVGVYLVTEYASRGDVFGELDRRGGSMTEADAVRQVLSPFLSALEYLHMLNIIHRDIKPENLLFTATGVLKVADFGLSIDITQERPVTRVGTLDYMAPEVVVCPDKVHPNDHKEKTHLHYTYLVDAWAVGVLAYELTVGRAPFDAGHKRGTIDNILHAQPRYPGWISDSCRHFVSWSLTKDAGKRPGIQQLGEHPWIHQYAAPARAQLVNPGRAASCYNLTMQPGMPQQPAGQQQQSEQHQPRHKMVASDATDAPLAGLQEEEELFLSAHGDPMRTASTAAAPAAASAPAAAAACKLPVPGSAVVINATSGSAAAAAAVPAPGSSPFAGAPAQQQPPAAAATTGGVLGAAADKLRAFVHRCQSANDLDGLRAVMMTQPPEPSNACFEPGGRFYTGPSAAQQQASAAAAAAAAAGTQQPPVLANGSAHDSATSVSSHSNGSISNSQQDAAAAAAQVPADQQQQQQFANVLKPLSTPAAGGCFGGMGNSKPLQLIRLPQQGRADSSKALNSPVDGSKGSPATAGTNSSADMELHVSHNCSLPAGSPMAVSPAALKRSTSAGTHAGQTARPFSTASTESESCSSSCADNAARDNSSICSSRSWGYGQATGEHSPMDHSPTTHLQLQHAAHAEMLPPRPHTPPRLGGAKGGNVLQLSANSGSSPYGGSKLAVMSGATAPTVQQLSTGSALNFDAAAMAAAAPGCADLQQVAGAALAAGKHVLVNISAECGVPSELQGSDQQAAAMTINSCFGFLKTAGRR